MALIHLHLRLVQRRTLIACITQDADVSEDFGAADNSAGEPAHHRRAGLPTSEDAFRAPVRLCVLLIFLITSHHIPHPASPTSPPVSMAGFSTLSTLHHGSVPASSHQHRTPSLQSTQSGSAPDKCTDPSWLLPYNTPAMNRLQWSLGHPRRSDAVVPSTQLKASSLRISTSTTVTARYPCCKRHPFKNSGTHPLPNSKPILRTRV
ncbi:hypothetical protein EI94DRAFT_869159 [Lactarius quietus]|nr:hypothetical protein EI94DRAFT_869159 [Lactarius quietus]